MKFISLLLSITFLFTANTLAQSKVDNFGLKDQSDKYVEVNFPSDRPVVLIFGDRKGAGQIEGWSKPIYSRYGEQVYLFGIASLGGVPKYARGLVRRLIKRQTNYPVLLDWGGKVAARFGYEKDKALLVVIDRQGSVITKKTGAATQSVLDSIYRDIERVSR